MLHITDQILQTVKPCFNVVCWGKIFWRVEQVTKPDSALDGQGVYYPVLPPQVIIIIPLMYERVLVDSTSMDGADVVTA
jgi:hypothetical protein